MNYIETCTKIAVFLWRSSNYRPLTSVLHVRPGWIIYQNMQETWEKKVMKFEREIPIGLDARRKKWQGGAEKAPPPMGLGLSESAAQRLNDDSPNSLLNANRAFSCDVMLSSNRAAAIATAINIHSFMQASFYISVRKGFSMNFCIRCSSAWWSRARMVRVTALDIQVNLREPTAMLEHSMT